MKAIFLALALIPFFCNDLLAAPCTPLPETGMGIEYDPGFLHRTGLIRSRVSFENRDNLPVIAIVQNNAGNRRIMAVAIGPSRNVSVNLPIAEYSLVLLVGNRWCNMDSGFLDGKRIDVPGSLAVEEENTTRVLLHATGPSPEDLAASFEKSPSTVIARDEISGGALLLQQENGGYFVNGHVNRIPVLFQVDTGASLTVISRETADRLGMIDCEPRSFRTAAGTVTGCVGDISEIDFGNFSVRYVSIAVLPNFKGALLGMDILGRFTIEQHGETLRIMR